MFNKNNYFAKLQRYLVKIYEDNFAKEAITISRKLIIMSINAILEIGLNQIKDGDMREYMLGDQSVLVVRVNNNYYAISNRCTHRGCSLSKGALKGSIVTCPCHGTKFDVTNGKMLKAVTYWPKAISYLTSFIIKDVKLFKTELRDQKVIVS